MNDWHPSCALLPEFVAARWWHHLLHNQTAWLLRVASLFRRHRLGQVRAIIGLPSYLRE